MDESPLKLTLQCDAPSALLSELEVAIQGHEMLHDVIKWTQAQSPPIKGIVSIAQDEYTHEFLVPLDEGYWLAYDCT